MYYYWEIEGHPDNIVDLFSFEWTPPEELSSRKVECSGCTVTNK
jgi:hypothetical protein